MRKILLFYFRIESKLKYVLFYRHISYRSFINMELKDTNKKLRKVKSLIKKFERLAH